MKKTTKLIVAQIVVSIGGLYLSELIISRVNFDLRNFNVVIAGLTLGILNLTVRPILKIMAIPLRIITLGSFSLVINGAMIWVVTAVFPEIDIPLILPLVYTTLIMFTLNLIFTSLLSTK